MREPIRVLILGTGQMGSGIARLVLERQGLDLVGAYGKRPARAGTDLGPAIGLDRDLGVAIDSDLARVVDRARPDIAIQATCSRLADAWLEVSLLLGRQVSVISIAEEMAYPACRDPALADEMHRLAVNHGVSVLGTGINPGFVLDLLVIALTGICADIESIHATRVNDLSQYGPSVLEAQGIGLTPDAFETGVEQGTVVGHYGFPESMHMIAAPLGWQIDRIEETRRPIVSQVRRETPFVVVEPGAVAGCLHTAVAYSDDRPLISFFHPQQVQPEREGVETGDTIEIAGAPNLRLASRPEIPGPQGTIALAVNMIGHLLNAAPGLHTMADLPVPAAMLGDARQVVRPHGD